jgi:hypothetical protein
MKKDENPPLHPALGSGKTKAHKCSLENKVMMKKRTRCVSHEGHMRKKIK